MSAQANLVAFDGASTPVSHTLIALGTSAEADGSKIAEWGERLATVPEEAQVTALTRRRKLKSGKILEVLTVVVPVMESISGQNDFGYTAKPAVAFPETFVITHYKDPRSTVTTARIARQLALNIAGGIATSVTPVTTGPAPELFDQGITPS